MNDYNIIFFATQKEFLVTTKPLEYYRVELNPQLRGEIKSLTRLQAIDLQYSLNRIFY